MSSNKKDYKLKRYVTISKPKRWTQDALYCYERNSLCKGCKFKAILETPCRLKLVVGKLLVELGKPDVEEIERTMYRSERFTPRE